jgi:hypothetical protein
MAYYNIPTTGATTREDALREFARRYTPQGGHRVKLTGLELAKLTLAKQDRAKTREAKKRMRTAKQWRPIAQTAFNAYIRLRDAGRPCICCGEPFEPQTHGGSVDAGHFLSRGSAPHLRFNEDNVHAQRKNCNMPGGTTRNAFRAGMIERIGLDRVLALEADQSVKKYTAADLEALTDHYRALTRQLRKDLP